MTPSLRLLSLLAAALTFHTAPVLAAEPDAKALASVTLNIGQNNGELEPLWRASGVFDGAPYKIQYSSFNNALDNYTALAAGNIDVSSSAVNTALQLQQAAPVAWTVQTAPLKVLSTRHSDYEGSPDRFVILASRKSGIRELNAATLRGKKFAYSPGANNYLLYLATLAHYGVKPDELTPVELDTTANSLALLNGSVDLVSGSIDLYGAALEDGAKVVSSSSKLKLPLVSGLLANTKALNDPLKGAAIKDFALRYVRFENWFTTHPEEAQAAFINGRHFKKAQALAAWKASRVLVKPVDANSVKDAETVSALLRSAGAFKKTIDVSVIFDERFSADTQKVLKDIAFESNLQRSVRSGAAP